MIWVRFEEPNADMDVLNQDPTNTPHRGGNPSDHAPGVYVRQTYQGSQDPQELDMLWSNRQINKDDKRPVAMFLFGLLIGAAITTAGFMVYSNTPELPFSNLKLSSEKAQESSVVTTPNEVSTEKPSEVRNNVRQEQRTQTSKRNGSKRDGRMTSDVAGRSYEVQSGDNLGAIAIRFYGSNDPTLVKKIQLANNMSNPDSIRLGQKLVIPPRNY